MLGVAGICIEEQPRRADHILSLVDAGKINLKSPLRYYGRLADEPEKLPWKQAEHAMLQENSADLRADVLQVGHHGSKNSTTQEFLDAVAPTIAIISAGDDNPYGHPSPELLERLEASGARVLRTDRDGAVHIVTDGDRLEISCFMACAKLATVTSSKSAEAPN